MMMEEGQQHILEQDLLIQLDMQEYRAHLETDTTQF